MSMEDFRTGYGRDWLDFAVTLLDRYTEVPHELVDTPAQLRAWLTEWGLAPAGPVTEDDVARAQRLREALHGLAKAAATEQPSARRDVLVVDASLLDDAPLELRRTGGTVASSRPATTRQALARLARQAVDDLTGPNRVRLRACGDEQCSGIFLDPTGRRRWCSDERCGVKARVRAHRARAKERAAEKS
jgi:predicted RNA-binding Zn ribbon-like protein